jgi:hypothetical protein
MITGRIGRGLRGTGKILEDSVPGILKSGAAGVAGGVGAAAVTDRDPVSSGLFGGLIGLGAGLGRFGLGAGKAGVAYSKLSMGRRAMAAGGGMHTKFGKDFPKFVRAANPSSFSNSMRGMSSGFGFKGLGAVGLGSGMMTYASLSSNRSLQSSSLSDRLSYYQRLDGLKR